MSVPTKSAGPKFSKRLEVLLRKPGTVLAVGDVHGCAPALDTLLGLIRNIPRPVVFLGDYVDRGPSSIRVVSALLECSAEKPDWVFLCGNHEQMLLDQATSSREEVGAESLESNAACLEYLSRMGGVPLEHIRFLGGMPFWARRGNLLFVHGGISSAFANRPIERHPPDSLTWTCGVSPKWNGPMVVSGHMIVEDPTVEERQILLDTGCFLGRPLTCGILDSRSARLLAALQVPFSGEGFREWFPPGDPR